MKIKTLIFEDEKYAAEELSQLLSQYDAQIEVIKVIDSVKDGVEWLNHNPLPDLILMDIQLADGSCFEIFDYIKINIPIIFTTAYDEFAIKAFKVNSIDYILKPIDQKSLGRAIDKFKELNFRINNGNNDTLQEKVENLIESTPEQYRQRFLIQIADKYHIVNTSNVLFFYIEDNSVFLREKNGHNYSLDYTLDKVYKLLNPQKFFRINRKYIIHLTAIEKMISYSQYRVKLKLHHCHEDYIIVSRERVKDFKTWIER